MAEYHTDSEHEPEHEDKTDRLFDTTRYDDYTSRPGVYRSDTSGPWYLVECWRSERCPGCGSRPGHLGCIVIAVDSACHNNGAENAVAACAAYVHPLNTTYNSSSLLNGPVQTNQRGELTAALLAINIAEKIKDLNHPLRKDDRLDPDGDGPETSLVEVVIKSDSEYIVKSMTCHRRRDRKSECARSPRSVLAGQS